MMVVSHWSVKSVPLGKQVGSNPTTLTILNSIIMVDILSVNLNDIII